VRHEDLYSMYFGYVSEVTSISSHFLAQRSSVVVNSATAPRRIAITDIPQDPRELKSWMLHILQEYGEKFLVFGTEDQPNVFAAPEPKYRELRSGNLDPRELRSWRYLDFALQFFGERYGLFPDQHLIQPTAACVSRGR
jgi:hypothetical protein